MSGDQSEHLDLNPRGTPDEAARVDVAGTARDTARYEPGRHAHDDHPLVDQSVLTERMSDRRIVQILAAMVREAIQWERREAQPDGTQAQPDNPAAEL